MEKLKLEILGLSSSQSHTGSFALVLGEEAGNRRLPIIIGMFEAQAIAIEIEKINPNRPMTHDLFRSFAMNFNFNVEEIIISDLKEGVFFAKIVCTDSVKTVEIDSRPSDAIAVGLRFNVPIYTYENILSEAGIVLNEEDEENESESEELKDTQDSEEKKPKAKSPKKDTKSDTKKDPYKDNSVDQLNALLDDALAKEDYEKAAKIRDEINKRN